MSYSRRQLYALGEPLGDSVTVKKVGGGRIYGGGGGGGGGGPSQSTTYNTNIPEYAKPYVTTMLGATQKQLFEGTPTAEGGYDITGFRGYKPYSTDVNNYFAGFSPMQRQAQQATAGLQTPGEYNQAAQMTGLAGLGALGLSGQMAGAGQQFAQQAQNPMAMQGYMSPYMQNVVDYQKSQALRDYQMGQPIRQAQAVGQGAFGGSRQAIVEAEAQRNLGSQLQGITATGSQKAFEDAQRQQQFGATLGLQGQQAGLQGLGQFGQMASQLGQLGGARLGAQRDIINMQSQMGKEQQALEQAKINQAIQDYATQQQYPLMQLGFMSNMLRGLPMQATTTQSYQAMPSTLNQGLGVLAGAAGAKQAGLFAEGGTIKGLAAGGVTGYANRGMVQANPDSGVVRGVRAKLEMMTADQLQKVAQTSPSEEIRAMAIQILQEQKIREQAEAQAQQSIAQDQQRGLPTPVTERAGLPAAPAGSMDTLNAASGGIVAFAGQGPSQVKAPDMSSEEYAKYISEFMNSDISTQRKREVAPGLGEALNQILKRENPGAFETSQNKGLGATVTEPTSTSTSTRTRVSGSNINDEAYKVPIREEALAQIKKRNEDLGITGSPRESLSKFYAKEQESLADAEKQARGYDLLNFGLNLATQPGSLMYAGARAGQATLPGMIERQEKLRGRKGDIAKGMAEIEQADRLERLGYAKEAEVMRENALNRFSKKDIAIMEAESRRAIASKETNLQEIYNDVFADLVKNQKMDPNNPNTRVIARRIAAGISGLTAEKVDVQKEAQVTKKEKEDGELRQLEIDLMGAETPQERAAIQQKMAAARQRIRNEVYKTEPTAAPTAGGKGKLVEGPDGIQTYQPGA